MTLISPATAPPWMALLILAIALITGIRLVRLGLRLWHTSRIDRKHIHIERAKP